MRWFWCNGCWRFGHHFVFRFLGCVVLVKEVLVGEGHVFCNGLDTVHCCKDIASGVILLVVEVIFAFFVSLCIVIDVIGGFGLVVGL